MDKNNSDPTIEVLVFFLQNLHLSLQNFWAFFATLLKRELER